MMTTSLSASFHVGGDMEIKTQEHTWGSVLQMQSDDSTAELTLFILDVASADRIMSALADVREHLEGLEKDAAKPVAE